MKFRPASDFHIEFLGDYHSHCMNNGRDWNSYTLLPKMEDEKEQTLVLGGDICMLEYTYKLKPLFADLSKRFKEVLVICGNHEFYRHEFVGAYDRYREFLKEWSNVILLQNSSITRDGIEIFGATMWTNFDKSNYNAMLYASGAMSDFKVIKRNDAVWRPEDSVKEHEETIYLMREFFKKNEGKKKVIITHHLPSEICNDPRFKGSLLNPAFSSNLNDLILDEKPNLWIFGHTHHSSMQTLGETVLLSNPRGYYNGTENGAYNGKLVVDTSTWS